MSLEKQRHKSLFLRALELGSQADQDAFLNAACPDDAQLRDEIKSLLSAHADPPPALRRMETAANNGVDLTELPVALIGRYKLKEQIGEGGMGVVYMAEQTDPVERRVALKIIKPGMDSKRVIARFEAERQALAMMDHPNIAKVLDAGTTGETQNHECEAQTEEDLLSFDVSGGFSAPDSIGRPFFVMELVDGTPITEFCDEEKLTIRERLELFVTVCRAVQHAHQKGIIHRDIKPTNILVARYEDKAVPKIIDFGLAKATSQKLTKKTMFTDFGQIVGTMEYMSPEQARFGQPDVDTRSDIYSLGVLLYELLSGEPPFNRSRLEAVAFDELVRIIREEEPLRPSTKLSSSNSLADTAINRSTDPKRLSLLVRGELDWIVMKALEKDRNERYDTAGVLADDVLHYLNDEPISACPPSPGYRLRKFALRNKTMIAATSMVVLSLMVGTGVATWQAILATLERDRAVIAEGLAADRLVAVKSERDRAITAEKLAHERFLVVQHQIVEIKRERARALRSEDRAKDEAAIAAEVNRFLQNDLLAQAIPSNEPDRDIKLRTVLDRAATKVAGRFRNRPIVEADIRHMIGLTYLTLGEYSAAQPHLVRALELQREHLGTQHPDTLDSMNNLAVLDRNLGEYAAAEALFRQTLESRRYVLGAEHPKTLTTMSNLAVIYQIRGELEKAESLLTDALNNQRRILGADHPDTLTSTNILAGIYKMRKKYAEAEALLAETLAIRRNTLGDEHPRTLVSMNNLALLYQMRGRYDQAEALFVRTLQLRRRVLGSEHPRTLISMNNLARLYRVTGRYEEERKLCNEVLTIQRQKPPIKCIELVDFFSQGVAESLKRWRSADVEQMIRAALSIHEDQPFELERVVPQPSAK